MRITLIFFSFFFFFFFFSLIFCFFSFFFHFYIFVCLYYYWSLLYSAILRSRADSLRSRVILHEWIAFYSAFFEYPPKWCTYSAGMAGATRNCCHLGAFCVHRNNHAPCHFMQSHIRKVYACLAVTCHLRFWQNDRGLLRATAVTRGWNGYRNKSQHRKLTLEKNILPPLLQGFKPATFRSRVRRSNHWAIPALFMMLLLIQSTEHAIVGNLFNVYFFFLHVLCSNHTILKIELLTLH